MLHLYGCFAIANNTFNNTFALIAYIKECRVVCKNHKFSFKKLIEKDDSCKIHESNLQKLVTAIFKVKMNLPPEIIKDSFELVECPYIPSQK